MVPMSGTLKLVRILEGSPVIEFGIGYRNRKDLSPPAWAFLRLLDKSENLLKVLQRAESDAAPGVSPGFKTERIELPSSLHAAPKTVRAAQLLFTGLRDPGPTE